MITITDFFHRDTNTFTYVVHDPHTKDAIIIDPVLDFDPYSFRISHTSIGTIIEYLQQEKLKPHLIIDTHVHADHMTGAYELKKMLKTKSAIGKGFFISQEHFATYFEIDPSSYEPPYDLYLDEGQLISCGSITVKALYTPGHTPTCMSFVIEDAVFVGDTLFQPSLGCGRCDFPAGAAAKLYDSIREKLYRLPDTTRVFVGHDYPNEHGHVSSQTTIAMSKQSNAMIPASISKEDFIHNRQQRDKTLAAPRLLTHAMQVNILGGQLPKKSKNGRPFLFMPLINHEL